MQAVPIQMFGATALTDTLQTLYSSPANKKTIISKLSFSNNAAVAATVTVHTVPAAGTPDDTNMVIKEKLLDIGESWSAYTVEGLVLKAGETLQLKTDAQGATKVVAVSAGVEVF